MTDKDIDFEDPVIMHRQQLEEERNRFLADWITPIGIVVFGGSGFFGGCFVHYAVMEFIPNLAMICGIAAILCAQLIAPLMILKRDLKEGGYL